MVIEMGNLANYSGFYQYLINCGFLCVKGVRGRDQRLFIGMVVVKIVVVSVAEIGVEKDLGVLGTRVEVEVPSESHLGTNDLNDNIGEKLFMKRVGQILIKLVLRKFFMQ